MMPRNRLQGGFATNGIKRLYELQVAGSMKSEWVAFVQDFQSLQLLNHLRQGVPTLVAMETARERGKSTSLRHHCLPLSHQPSFGHPIAFDEPVSHVNHTKNSPSKRNKRALAADPLPRNSCSSSSKKREVPCFMEPKRHLQAGRHY